MNASKLKIFQFPCRQDNYGVILHDPQSNVTISIDAPETEAIIDVLESKGLQLTHILTTHHHGDHVEGNETLKSKYGCTIIGPVDEAAKIPGLDDSKGHGDSFDIAGHRIKVIGTPGHTLGQIAYYFPDQGVVFCADALFALGCGRIFEGTPDMMFAALSRLAGLPAETQVYAGHEYTLANAKFALSVDPDNQELIKRAKEIEALRDNGKPTLPSTIELELKTNPFLRADDASIRAHLGMESASDLEVFTEIRARKDRF